MMPDRPLSSGEVFRRTLDLLVELCAMSSPTGDAAGLRRMAARLSAELSRFGFSCDTIEERDAEGVPQPVLIARGPTTGARRVLLVGHMDTVLASAAAPRVTGDRLVGTGALDMKAGLATLLGAIDLLVADGRPLPDGLTLVAVPDEEASASISQRVTRCWGAVADVVLVLEPGEVRTDAETVVAGRRGLTEWQLQVVGRSAHSGLAYWDGRSALAAAADWCLRAGWMSSRASGPTVNVGRLVAGTADFVDALPGNCNLLGSSRQRNAIPERAIADGEVRYLSAAEGTEVLTQLAALADVVAVEHEVRTTLETGVSLPPVNPGPAGEALARRVVELAAARGFRLEVEKDRGGASFPNYLTDTLGVPVIDGLGPGGGAMHTREEWLDLRSLDRRIALLADLLATL